MSYQVRTQQLSVTGFEAHPRRVRFRTWLVLGSSAILRNAACLNFRCRRRRNVKRSLNNGSWRRWRVQKGLIQRVWTGLPTIGTNIYRFLWLLIDINLSMTNLLYRPLSETLNHLLITILQTNNQIAVISGEAHRSVRTGTTSDRTPTMTQNDYDYRTTSYNQTRNVWNWQWTIGIYFATTRSISSPLASGRKWW